MKTNRCFFTLISVILLVSLLAACTPPLAPTQPPAVPTKAPAAAATAPAPTKAPEPVTISVWLLGNSGPGVKAALPGFQAKYPNIKVDLQVFGWNDLLPKLQAALTAKAGGPDVVEIFSNQMRGFVDSGAFMSLNKNVEPYQKDLASFAFLDSKDEKGNIYGVAWSVSPMLLFYRSDIFEAEKIDPASLKTWDDLLTAGKKVTHDGQYMFLTASQSTQPQYFNYFTGMLSQLGGTLFDPQNKIAVNESDRALKVLQTMEAIRDAKISMDVDAWWTPAFEAALKSGKVASLSSGTPHIDVMKTTDLNAKGKWRIQLAPTFKDGKATGMFTAGGRVLSIPTQTKQAEASWKFMEYMMFNQDAIKAGWENGAIVPIYKPAFTASFFDNPDPYFGDQKVGRIVMDGLKVLDGVQWNSGPIPSGLMANEIIGPQLRNLMTGKADSKTALEAILKDMKAKAP